MTSASRPQVSHFQLGSDELRVNVNREAKVSVDDLISRSSSQCNSVVNTARRAPMSNYSPRASVNIEAEEEEEEEDMIDLKVWNTLHLISLLCNICYLIVILRRRRVVTVLNQIVNKTGIPMKILINEERKVIILIIIRMIKEDQLYNSDLH